MTIIVPFYWQPLDLTSALLMVVIAAIRTLVAASADPRPVPSVGGDAGPVRPITGLILQRFLGHGVFDDILNLDSAWCRRDRGRRRIRSVRETFGKVAPVHPDKEARF